MLLSDLSRTQPSIASSQIPLSSNQGNRTTLVQHGSGMVGANASLKQSERVSAETLSNEARRSCVGGVRVANPGGVGLHWCQNVGLQTLKRVQLERNSGIEGVCKSVVLSKHGFFAGEQSALLESRTIHHRRQREAFGVVCFSHRRQCSHQRETVYADNNGRGVHNCFRRPDSNSTLSGETERAVSEIKFPAVSRQACPSQQANSVNPDLRQSAIRFFALGAAILIGSSSVLPVQEATAAPETLQRVEETEASNVPFPEPFRELSIGFAGKQKTGLASTPGLMTAPQIESDIASGVPGSHNVELWQTANLDSLRTLTPPSSTQVRSLVNQVRSRVSSLWDAASGNGAEALGTEKPVGNPVEKSLPATSPDLNPEVNANLVLEAWNVVDQVYLDARGKGFDREAWAAKRDEALKHPIRSRIAAYSTVRGLLGSLNDPYTRFLTPDQFQALSKFDVSGIGLNMGEVDDDNGVTSLRVLGVVHDSSAHAAGIRQGDELLSVGGVSVRGKSAFEATSLIQGPVGQPVTLQLQKATGEVFEAVVPRGKEAQQPVSYKLQKDAEGRPAGYVKLRDFSALAKKGVVDAIQKLREAGAQSFILDLQDNLGGLVQAGIEIARLFLAEGETVVYTVGRTPETQRNVLAQGPALLTAPLIVLVNESTASASEIVAGALHDNCRALLVGNKTYGKGLIQSVYELSDGSALAITVGKYITPGHIDIDKYGIEPDFVRSPGPFNIFLPLPSVKEIEAKLKSCVPPEIERQKDGSVTSPSLAKS